MFVLTIRLPKGALGGDGRGADGALGRRDGLRVGSGLTKIETRKEVRGMNKQFDFC